MRPLVIFVVAAMFLDGGAALADTLRVPGEYATIQAAIDAAVDGDVVEIADGTYTEAGNRNLDFDGKAITVCSASGDPARCIIDCERRGRGFIFNSGEGPDSVVRGLTITNGSKPGGGALRCDFNSSPTIIRCRIIRNSASNGGGGVFCSASSPTFVDCAIDGNLTRERDGGGVCCLLESQPTFTRCTITGNTSADTGGGISCDDRSSPTLTNCIISGNSSEFGGGVGCQASDPLLVNCEITGNTARNAGGGLLCVLSDPRLINCTISGNSAGVEGGGVFVTFLGRPVFDNCILWGDTPQEIVVASGNAIINYSGVSDGWVGAGNIDADPLFVDPDGPDDEPGTWADNDYRVLFGSPVIDAAHNGLVPADTFDIDGDGDTYEPLPFDLNGRPRFVDDPGTEDTGHGGPPVVDMGAHELQDGCLRVPRWLCDGDVDGDGRVNPVDVGLVQAAFGSGDEQDLCNYDVDCDGQINPVDSGIVQSLFGTCDAPRIVCP